MRNQAVFVLAIVILLFGSTAGSFAVTLSFQGLGGLVLLRKRRAYKK